MERLANQKYTLAYIELIAASLTGYPFWKITGFMKTYYLLQFSYWLQQFLVLVLGLEKPRKDFKELVIHHIVTLWLVGCVQHVYNNHRRF